MKLSSTLFTDGGQFPADCAFCCIDPVRHARLSHNLNPQLSWSGAPQGTRSFALICHDPDAPSCAEKANREGHHLPASLPRVDFFHWLVFDLPAGLSEIRKGECPSQVVPHGQPAPPAPHGARYGLNDFTEGTSGDHYGYDGPCPPWNDDIPHRYCFTLFALDLERLPVAGRPEPAAVTRILRPHVLAEAQLVGLYSLNRLLKNSPGDCV